MLALKLGILISPLLISWSSAALLEARQDISLPHINDNITAKGKLWFGSAIDITYSAELSDTKYMTIWNTSGIYGSTTPINSMKWAYTEPTQGNFALAEGRRTLALAAATGKKVRCHNLVWVAALPTWVTSGTWTKQTLSAVMKKHIQTLITQYGTACYSWDVVNEALNADGTYTKCPFLSYIGPAYVPLAFQYANQAVQSLGGGIKLYYNEYGAEAAGVKQQAVVNLIKQVQSTSGAHIDGVGLESHMNTTYYPTLNSLMSAMSAYSALGIDIAITELDVACKAQGCPSTELQLQARLYYNSVISCMQTPRCIGVTVWDFVDKYSYENTTSPCLYYSNYTRHPAYTAVAQAIYQWDCGVCG